MRACYQIEIETPKQYQLDGLWLGPKKAKNVIVWVHGLGSSMFRKLKIADELIDKDTAVLAFNNRGHDKVTRLSRADGKSFKGGAAHEVFTDCVDDIDGTIAFAKKHGAKNIFLVGHSTGCQKSAYWGAKRGKGVKGIMLLSPVSDYSSERMAQGAQNLKRAEKVARLYMAKGKKHTMLPEEIWQWPWIADAQRFLSLYTGKGPEEIFTYWKPQRDSKTLRSVRIPVFAIIAEHDEYCEEPADDVREWFAQNIRKGEVVVVRGAGHSFHKMEKKVAGMIRTFMKDALQ